MLTFRDLLICFLSLLYLYFILYLIWILMYVLLLFFNPDIILENLCGLRLSTLLVAVHFMTLIEEEFGDTKGVIRIRISKRNRQHVSH